MFAASMHTCYEPSTSCSRSSQFSWNGCILHSSFCCRQWWHKLQSKNSLIIHISWSKEKVTVSVNWWQIYSLGHIHSGENQELLLRYLELNCPVTRLNGNRVRGTISIPLVPFSGYNSECTLSYFHHHHTLVPFDNILLMWFWLLCWDSRKKTKWWDNRIEYRTLLMWDLSVFALHWKKHPKMLVHNSQFC